jgi:hypothetical protein
MPSQRTSKLFQPIKVGALNLEHRVILAPLTRGRADASGVPAPYATDYYSQRATRTLFYAVAYLGRPSSYKLLMQLEAYSSLRQHSFLQRQLVEHSRQVRLCEHAYVFVSN